MRKILIFTLMLLCSFSAFGQSKKTKKLAKPKVTTTQTKNTEYPQITISSPITDEEYAVFMTILGKDRGNFVVEDKTSVDDFGGSGIDYLKQNFDELKPETSEDFVSKNKKSAQMEKKFPTKNNYTIITNEELKKFFDKGLDWEGFYKKYPNSGGIYNFSKVGFSKDGKQALIFVTNSCGGLCGEGNYIFLKKENNEWKVIKKQMTWIS